MTAVQEVPVTSYEVGLGLPELDDVPGTDQVGRIAEAAGSLMVEAPDTSLAQSTFETIVAAAKGDPARLDYNALAEIADHLTVDQLSAASGVSAVCELHNGTLYQRTQLELINMAHFRYHGQSRVPLPTFTL